jgi:hypothetical protein
VEAVTTGILQSPLVIATTEVAPFPPAVVTAETPLVVTVATGIVKASKEDLIEAVHKTGFQVLGEKACAAMKAGIEALKEVGKVGATITTKDIKIEYNKKHMKGYKMDFDAVKQYYRIEAVFDEAGNEIENIVHIETGLHVLELEKYRQVALKMQKKKDLKKIGEILKEVTGVWCIHKGAFNLLKHQKTKRACCF